MAEQLCVPAISGFPNLRHANVVLAPGKDQDAIEVGTRDKLVATTLATRKKPEPPAM